MNYSQFLFVQLLMANSEVVSDVPYDDIWNNYEVIYNEYVNSAFDTPNQTEYQCITEFIQTYIQKIDNTFRKFI